MTMSTAAPVATNQANETIELYSDRFWISPYVFSVYVTLKEKGLPFETRLVQLDAGEHRKPEYLGRFITGKVPSLSHGGFFLAESSAIVEYLEEVFPAPRYPAALPRDVRERARARQVMAFIRSDMLPIREERPTTTMFYGRAERPLSDEAEAAARRLLRIADQLIPEGRRSLFGAWSTADADLAFMLQRLIMNGHPVDPKVRAFADEQWSRPSVRAFVERERLPFVPY
jgi:glutathione S-transferase